VEGIDLEQGIELLLENIQPTERLETVDLLSSLGRVCAKPVEAPMDNPPFDRSPLDGYTFAAAATSYASKASPAKFKIVGEVCAGQYFTGTVKPGEAVRIMTGGKIPAGCDCVVRQEDVRADEQFVEVMQVLKEKQNYVFQGEDIKKNAVLLSPGEIITPAHIGSIASMGFKELTVYAKPRVIICSTGDELLSPGQPLTEGKIYNSNLYVLAARLKELGAASVMFESIADDSDTVAAFIREHMEEADLFLTTGGVSVGKKDIMHDVIKKLPARRLFWRICMKPGTPVLSYVHKDKLGIALSGNPFAALATFELLVRPVLAKISRHPGMNYKRKMAVLQEDFPKESKGRRFIRANVDDGKVWLPGKNHSSGSLFSAVGCNAMIDIPAGSGALARNSAVEIVQL